MRNRHSKLVFGGAAAIVLVILGGLAVVLADSQSSDRDELAERFSKRPQVSAALTSSLFSATSTSPEQQKQLTRLYGGKTVSNAALTEDAREDNNAFKALLDDRGRLIGLSAGAPSRVRAELRSRPSYVRNVLSGAQPTALSDFLELSSGDARVQAFAQQIETPFGRRILVTGFPPEILYAFLSDTLSRLIDITGGQAYILDSTGSVVASSDPKSRPGEPVDVAGLADAVASDQTGPFGSGEYFAASPVENSSWQVVSVAPEAEVFALVGGSGKWAPWAILAALALAAGIAFLLLWRVLRSADELADAHSELDLTNKALEQRATELERSNTELEQFASIASHDLQEPLRKVQMFSDRVFEIEAENLTPQGRDYLRRATEAASRMQLLIEDLLTFSRVTTQSRPLVSTDLEQVAREVVWDLEAAIHAADGRVEISELPTVPVDEPQIRQLFQNLISNALKFRREGVPPVVRVEGAVRGRYAEIRVSDNGIGFEARYANRIFRVFERLQGRGRYEGNGIGLALCRKIVEGHGGTIVAESTPGEGSTFIVELPLQGVTEPRMGPRFRKRDTERQAAGV